MTVHGTEDTVVPMEYGDDLCAEIYENDPRFTFGRYAERGHTVFAPYYKTADKSLMTRIVQFCDSWVTGGQNETFF